MDYILPFNANKIYTAFQNSYIRFDDCERKAKEYSENIKNTLNFIPFRYTELKIDV